MLNVHLRTYVDKEAKIREIWYLIFGSYSQTSIYYPQLLLRRSLSLQENIFAYSERYANLVLWTNTATVFHVIKLMTKA